MCRGVIVVGGLLSSFATMVKVVVRQVVFYHSHNALPVGVEFGFSEDDDVVVISSDVIIDNFPGGSYAFAVDSGNVGSLG